MRGFKCLSFALLFVVSSIGLSISFFDNVNAASDYDNLLNVVVQNNPEYHKPLDHESITVCPAFYSINDWESGWDKNISNSSSQDIQAFRQSYNQAKQTGAVSVSYLHNSHSGTMVEVFWVEYLDDSQEMIFDGESSTFTRTLDIYADNFDLKFARFVIAQNHTRNIIHGCEWAIQSLNEQGQHAIVAWEKTEENRQNKPYYLLYSTFPVVYPDGYSGDLVPESSTRKPILRPHVKIEVDDYHVKLRSPPMAQLHGIDYKIYWFIHNLSFDGEGQPNQFVLDGHSEPDQTLEFDSPEYQDLNIQAYFKKPDGSNLESDQYNLQEFSTTIKIDGSTYFIDSNDLECDERNICTAPYDGLESCNILDIVCHVRNAIKLVSDLISNIIEAFGLLFENHFVKLYDLLEQRLGFLMYPISLVVDLIAAFNDGANRSQSFVCNWSFGQFFGDTFKLNFCMLENQFPTAFTTIRTLIQVLVGFGLLSAIHNQFRRTTEI